MAGVQSERSKGMEVDVSESGRSETIVDLGKHPLSSKKPFSFGSFDRSDFGSVHFQSFRLSCWTLKDRPLWTWSIECVSL